MTFRGKTVIEPEYDYIWLYDEGVFVVVIKEDNNAKGDDWIFHDTLWRCGVTDIHGNMTVPPVYIYNDPGNDLSKMEFHEGLAAVCVNGKWGYMNTPVKW